MRGAAAFTMTWEKPIQPAPIPKPKKAKRGRPRILTAEIRKQVYEKDLLVREIQADISEIFDAIGLNKEQRRAQMRVVRRNRG